MVNGGEYPHIVVIDILTQTHPVVGVRMTIIGINKQHYDFGRFPSDLLTATDKNWCPPPYTPRWGPNPYENLSKSQLLSGFFLIS